MKDLQPEEEVEAMQDEEQSLVVEETQRSIFEDTDTNTGKTDEVEERLIERKEHPFVPYNSVVL